MWKGLSFIPAACRRGWLRLFHPFGARSGWAKWRWDSGQWMAVVEDCECWRCPWDFSTTRPFDEIAPIPVRDFGGARGMNWRRYVYDSFFCEELNCLWPTFRLLGFFLWLNLDYQRMPAHLRKRGRRQRKNNRCNEAYWREFFFSLAKNVLTNFHWKWLSQHSCGHKTFPVICLTCLTMQSSHFIIAYVRVAV